MVGGAFMAFFASGVVFLLSCFQSDDEPAWGFVGLSERGHYRWTALFLLAFGVFLLTCKLLGVLFKVQ